MCTECNVDKMNGDFPSNFGFRWAFGILENFEIFEVQNRKNAYENFMCFLAD